MTTQTLSAWLLECIADDEAVARAATLGPWQAGERCVWSTGPTVDPYVVHDGDGGDGGAFTAENAAHIARHDPARMLATCAAHRRIVELHEIDWKLTPYEQSWGAGREFGCRICHEFDGIICGDGYCDTLRALATIYADCDGYREEWAL